MKKRWRIGLFVLLAVAGAASFLIWHRSEEPKYQGKPISYWFGLSCKSRGNDRTGSMVLAEAARAIGEPAVPFLLRQTQYRQGIIKTKWLQLEPHLPEFVRRFSPHPTSDDLVRGAAYAALMDMGPEAKSAVPELIKVFQRSPNDPAMPDHIMRASYVFQRIGPEAKDAVPYLLSFVGSQLNLIKDEFLLEEVIQALKEIGPEAKAAVPLLRGFVEGGSGRPRIAAALALWKIDGQTNLAVSFLESALENKDGYTVVVAIRGLREMEAPNEVIMPKMITLLKRPERQVRWEAVVTLGERRTAAVAAVPHLVELIRDADCQSETLSALANIRPAPEATVRAFAEFLMDYQQANDRREDVASAYLR